MALRNSRRVSPGFAGFRRDSGVRQMRGCPRAPLKPALWKKRYKVFRKIIVFLHRLECWNTPRTHFLECPRDMTVWNHGAKLSCRRDTGHSLQKRIRNPKTGDRKEGKKLKLRLEGRRRNSQGRKERNGQRSRRIFRKENRIYGGDRGEVVLAPRV